MCKIRNALINEVTQKKTETIELTRSKNPRYENKSSRIDERMRNVQSVIGAGVFYLIL